MAKAIGDIQAAGIKVSLVDINKSVFSFKPDAQNNQILFGLKGLTNIGDDVVHTIIANRPYSSMEDFTQKTNLRKQQMVSLIKGGAFDTLENKPREEIMYNYIYSVSNIKKKLTLQNLAGLIENNVLPWDLFEKEIRTFNFNKALKKNCSQGSYYLLNGIYADFYKKHFNTDALEIVNNNEAIHSSKWSKMYSQCMDTIRDYLKNNQQELLDKFNHSIVSAELEKYASGNKSSWEMDSLCFYHGEHELNKVNLSKYGISNFKDLISCEEDGFFVRNGVQIPLMKISRIAGTVIAKNKSKGTVSLLTTDGVVTVKFRLEHFALLDKRVSEIQPDGSKKYIEKSWFDRGSKVIITGYRRDDTFVCKKYAKTVGHSVYKIDHVLENGDLIIRHTRTGESE